MLLCAQACVAQRATWMKPSFIKLPAVFVWSDVGDQHSTVTSCVQSNAHTQFSCAPDVLEEWTAGRQAQCFAGQGRRLPTSNLDPSHRSTASMLQGPRTPTHPSCPTPAQERKSLRNSFLNMSTPAPDVSSSQPLEGFRSRPGGMVGRLSDYTVACCCDRCRATDTRFAVTLRCASEDRLS